MARPKLELDEDKIESLAAKGMTVKQIAAIFQCSDDTLYNNYSVAIKTGHELRNGSLQQKQFEVAMSDGHKAQGTMLVWLGKQHLEQRDKTENLSELQVTFQIVNQIERPERDKANLHLPAVSSPADVSPLAS
jgi:hypothetical protein